MQEHLTQVEILSYSYEGTTIFYQIQVKHGQKQWIVQKRYSQFEELNRVLELSFQGLPLLPKKNFITFLVGKSIEQINERKYGLQKYLQTIISRPEIYQTEALQQFLKLKTLEQEIKNELFKENVIEEVKMVNQDQVFQIQPIPEKILVEAQNLEKLLINSETQTSFIEVQVEKEIKEEIQEVEIQKQIERNDGLSDEENEKEELINQMKQQLQEYYDQVNEKELIIQNFDKKVEETQQYYNNEIFEKQRQINELQGQISQYQESYSYLETQNHSLQVTLEQKNQEVNQYNDSMRYLNSKIAEQEKIIEHQQVQIGFGERFGLVDLTQQQELIIEQQNMIDIQVEKNNENENHIRQEMEKNQLLEQQRDELLEENSHLKTQLEEEMQLKTKHADEIEQLKLQLEYLQIQIKEKQELLDIRNELSN